MFCIQFYFIKQMKKQTIVIKINHVWCRSEPPDDHADSGASLHPGLHQLPAYRDHPLPGELRPRVSSYNTYFSHKSLSLFTFFLTRNVEAVFIDPTYQNTKHAVHLLYGKIFLSLYTGSTFMRLHRKDPLVVFSQSFFYGSSLLHK